MKTRNSLSAAALTWSLAGLLAPVFLANLAYAASTVISDVPLAAAKRPNPNLIMAIDDSGSMDFEVGFNANDGALWWNFATGRFHGWVVNNSINPPSDKDNCTVSSSNAWGCTQTGLSANYNTGADTTTTDASGNPAIPMTWGKYGYLFPNGACGQTTTVGDYPAFPSARVTNSFPCDTRTYGDDFSGGGNNSGSNTYRHYTVAPTQQFAWTRSSAYNGMYYNPAVTYLPWKPYNDGTTNCPSGTTSGTGTSFMCTPGNASTTSTLSHPWYGSSSSQSNIALFGSLATPLDGSSNPVMNYTFRMYPGMIVPAGAKYRLCSTSVSSKKVVNNCGGWLTASGTANSCLTLPGTVNSCVGMGMPQTGTAIDMTNKPSGYSVNKPYDHADVSIAYNPATYWYADSACTVANVTAGLCAYGPDGQLIRKVTITSATTSYTAPVARSDCGNTATCTYAQESQNFANWFQYYRKRHLMLNAALGNAYDGLRGLRAGFFQFSDNGAAAVTMFDFDSTTGTAPNTVPDTTKNGTALIGQLYQNTASGGTPTRQSLDWIYQQFKRTDSAAPITNYCQFNAGFVVTDGFAGNTSASNLIDTYGNYDGQTPTSTTYQYNTPYGSISTNPYPDNYSNTLADIAMKMFTENPRPDLLPVGKVPVDKSDVTPGADRNPNLHINTYGMILGLNGSIFGNTATYLNQNNDPYTYPPSWNSLGDPTSAIASPIAIDELWHATLNGRGQMLLANSPEQTRDAVLTVVANVVAKGGAAAAVAVSNPNPVAGDDFAYSSSYNSGSWSGDINAYTINLTDATLSTTSNWNPTPQHQLAARDFNTRIIATYSGTAGVPFQWANLTTGAGSQQAALNNDSQVLSFLRGDRTKEGITFRGRGPRAPYPNNVVSDNIAVLGDIVNAEPVYVAAPKFSYTDNGYAAFKTGPAASRTKMLYQGANDGMLHAFNAVTGAEAWAYVPNAMFPNLLNLSSKNAFTHKFYVDGTPVSGDVPFAPNATAVAPAVPNYDWRTILVGAYAKGGRGYYALDVTDPSAVTSETALASKVLWEFPSTVSGNGWTSTDYLNIGNSFGRAIIVKTRAAGWVVLATSGYNNGTNSGDSGGDGKGHLFVLNATNGFKIADLSTGNGSATTPSGLAYISAWVDHANTDATVETVYGGDLTGSVWRFDLSGATTSNWAVQLVTKLVDASGNPQPVTTEPELGVVSGYRMIYVGTGQYLGAPDIPGATGANTSATTTQTMYALKEPKPYAATASPLTTALITPLRSSLVAQVATKNLTAGTVSITTTNPVNLATKSGWYIDLGNQTTGERIVTNPALGQGVLAFTTNTPNGTDPCLPGGSSWLYNVDYTNGGYVANSNATAGVVGKTFGNVLASRPQFIQLEHAGGTINPSTGVASGGTAGTYDIVHASDNTILVNPVPMKSAVSGGRRKSWREINVQ